MTMMPNGSHRENIKLLKPDTGLMAIPAGRSSRLQPDYTKKSEVLAECHTSQDFVNCLFMR